MSEQSGKRPRRRRGGRGGQHRGPQGNPAPQNETPTDGAQAPPGDERGPRQDSRRNARANSGARPSGSPPGPPSGGRGAPPGPQGGGRTHRAPTTGERPQRGDRPAGGDRNDRPRPGDRSNRGGERNDRAARGGDRPAAGRDRDRGPRVFETPTPQDERSIELGARFRETQVAMRDARKALAKRRAESEDEPEWMVEQLTAAEKVFEEASTAWTEHLETTGRKVVRR